VKSATSKKLSLVQIGRKLDFPIDALIDPVSERYPWIKVNITTPLADPGEAYDSRRNQYHSTRILALLESQIQSLAASMLLGVTSLDLFVPGTNFVFGEARLPGRAGVISTHRLKPQTVIDDPLFKTRIVKEAVHEIGHMEGLKHCSDARCVMHFSERLADTDLKSPDLCGNCQSQLRARIE
jgi:archaemetzincin